MLLIALNYHFPFNLTFKDLELQKQERSPKIRSRGHLQGERKEKKKERALGEKRRMTVGGASNVGNQAGCQLEHGGFLPKKRP